jgi:Ca2+-binding EF-hand superfamily protein
MITALLTTAAALSACETVPPPAAEAAAASNVCGTYGYVDVNKDGRISRSEFENCYRAGGFYRTAYYNPDYWTNYWSAFDANGDGYLSTDEYWSSAAWATIDRNHNGRIDSDEFVWWPH